MSEIMEEYFGNNDSILNSGDDKLEKVVLTPAQEEAIEMVE